MDFFINKISYIEEKTGVELYFLFQIKVKYY